MAKAILGYTSGPDPCVLAEICRLRQQVRDLEAVAERLRETNDALTARVSRATTARAPASLWPRSRGAPLRSLVDEALDERLSAGEPDDLTGQLRLAYVHHVEEPGPSQPADPDDRSGHPHDSSAAGRAVRLGSVRAAGQRRRKQLPGVHRALPIGSKVNS